MSVFLPVAERKGALPDGWPLIYVEAHCETCGIDLFAELFRPAVEERFRADDAIPGRLSISEFWLTVLQQHVELHKRMP